LFGSSPKTPPPLLMIQEAGESGNYSIPTERR
jgi:hypothetical protein